MSHTNKTNRKTNGLKTLKRLRPLSFNRAEWLRPPLEQTPETQSGGSECVCVCLSAGVSLGEHAHTGTHCGGSNMGGWKQTRAEATARSD